MAVNHDMAPRETDLRSRSCCSPPKLDKSLPAGGGSVEEVSEQVAALAEDRAKDLRDGEDELRVGNGQADVVGDPTGGLEGTALVAGGAEVAGLAGEGEQVLVTAAGADEANEAGGEVATTAEGLDGGGGFGPERAHGGADLLFDWR